MQCICISSENFICKILLLNSLFEEGSKDFVKESNSPKQIQVLAEKLDVKIGQLWSLGDIKLEVS